MRDATTPRPRPRRRFRRRNLAILGIAVLLVPAVYVPEGHSNPAPDGVRVAARQGQPARGRPIEVSLGSTPDEMERALILCASEADRCSRQDYATETRRTVEILPVDLDRREVTNREFAEWIEERRLAHRPYLTTAEQAGQDSTWRRPRGLGSSIEGLADHPVVCVSAFDAEAYCADRGARLPTRDEWEYTARGRLRRIYPWGDVWDPAKASHARAGRIPLTEPVGSYAEGATPLGHLDMAGSVWEWTATSAPEGRRYAKGGSAADVTRANLRSAADLSAPADLADARIGFRCARDVQAWPKPIDTPASPGRSRGFLLPRSVAPRLR